MYQHVLIPVDGSESSMRAIDNGIKMAKALGAQVTGLIVADPTYVREIDEGVHVNTDGVVGEVCRVGREAGVQCHCVTIRAESPHEGIVSFAKEKGCDLIIIGTKAHSRLEKFIIGSTAAAVLVNCDIPVLLYR